MDVFKRYLLIIAKAERAVAGAEIQRLEIELAHAKQRDVSLQTKQRAPSSQRAVTQSLLKESDQGIVICCAAAQSLSQLLTMQLTGPSRQPQSTFDNLKFDSRC